MSNTLPRSFRVRDRRDVVAAELSFRDVQSTVIDTRPSDDVNVLRAVRRFEKDAVENVMRRELDEIKMGEVRRLRDDRIAEIPNMFEAIKASQRPVPLARPVFTTDIIPMYVGPKGVRAELRSVRAMLVGRSLGELGESFAISMPVSMPSR